MIQLYKSPHEVSSLITFTIGPTITFSKVWYRDERTTVRVHTRLLRMRITTGSWIPQAASIEKGWR